MLFDLSAYQRERFVVTAIYGLLEYGPKSIVALEWQPEDGRAIRYLKPPDSGSVRFYYGAGRERTAATKATFAMETFDDVPIELLDWQPGASLAIKSGSVDVVLCTSGAGGHLGLKGLKEAIKESARVLKATGQFILFREADDKRPLPEAASTLFAVNQTREEAGLALQQLLPRSAAQRGPGMRPRVRPGARPSARPGSRPGARPARPQRGRGGGGQRHRV